VSKFCLSIAILVLTSHRTAKKLLRGDFTPKDNLPPLAGGIYTPAPSRIRGHVHFSIDSDTTLVADDDFLKTSIPSQPQPSSPFNPLFDDNTYSALYLTDN
jgi:hypothetical protein